MRNTNSSPLLLLKQVVNRLNATLRSETIPDDETSKQTASSRAANVTISRYMTQNTVTYCILARNNSTTASSIADRNHELQATAGDPFSDISGSTVELFRCSKRLSGRP